MECFRIKNLLEHIMRKLIVSNFVTVDGLYEGKDKSINSLYDYYHKDYYGDDSFDFYNVELLRKSDFLLLSRKSFLGNKSIGRGSKPTQKQLRSDMRLPI
jgi:hypothetical protein